MVPPPLGGWETTILGLIHQKEGAPTLLVFFYSQLNFLVFFPLSGIWFLGSKVGQALSIRVGAPSFWWMRGNTVISLQKKFETIRLGGPSYKHFGGPHWDPIETMQIWTKMGGGCISAPPSPIGLNFFLPRDNNIPPHPPKGGGANPSSFFFIACPPIEKTVRDLNPRPIGGQRL